MLNQPTPPIGWAFTLLGLVIFAYGYWHCRFESNINWKWQSLLALTLGGLLLYTCGLYVLINGYLERI